MNSAEFEIECQTCGNFYPADSSSCPHCSPDQEEQLYAKVAAEFENENRDEGLWAKCFAATDGNENQAKARYLKEKVLRARKAPQRGKLFLAEKVKVPAQQHSPFGEVEHPTIGCLFRLAWGSFRKQTMICIWNYVVYVILDMFLLMSIIGILLRPALYSGYMESMMRLARGQKIKRVDFIPNLSPPFSTANGAGWLLVLALFASAFLFLLPSFYLFTIWFFVFPIILHEEIGIVDAFRKSKLMTKGSFWKIFPKFLVTLALFATGLGIPLAVLMKVHYYFALKDAVHAKEAADTSPQ